MFSIKNLFLSFFLVAVSVPGAIHFLQTKKSAELIACTQEAKLCPDGSYVARTGPNCEFAKCPKVKNMPDQVFIQIADALESGNVEKALNFFNPSSKNRQSLTRLSPAGRAKVAESFRNAKIIDVSSEIRIYKIPSELKGGRVIYSDVGLGRTDTGEWRVFNW